MRSASFRASQTKFTGVCAAYVALVVDAGVLSCESPLLGEFTT